MTKVYQKNIKLFRGRDGGVATHLYNFSAVGEKLLARGDW